MANKGNRHKTQTCVKTHKQKPNNYKKPKELYETLATTKLPQRTSESMQAYRWPRYQRRSLVPVALPTHVTIFGGLKICCFLLLESVFKGFFCTRHIDRHSESLATVPVNIPRTGTALPAAMSSSLACTCTHTRSVASGMPNTLARNAIGFTRPKNSIHVRSQSKATHRYRAPSGYVFFPCCYP